MKTKSNKPVRIFIADDHTIVRQGLSTMLTTEPHFKIVGEACNGLEAVNMVADLNPQVVLMDIAMPILNGIDATRQIKKMNPETKVIILSMHSHDRYINELFRLGASGYLLKNSTGTDVINAIYAALEGGTYLSPSISRKVVEEYVTLKKQSPEEVLYGELSNREREVFQMIAEGRSTRQISEILGLSPNTIKTHRVNIMEKLQVDSLTGLILFAKQMKIIDI
jgi:two-component system, NarL family, response regulator NreC